MRSMRGKKIKYSKDKLDKLNKIIEITIKDINTYKCLLEINIFFETKIVLALQYPYVLNNFIRLRTEDLQTYPTFILEEI